MSEKPIAPQVFLEKFKEWNAQARKLVDAKSFKAASDLMYTIRGTAQVFGCFQIAYLTSIAEQLSYYSAQTENSKDIRKCRGCIWDILTTLDYMIAQGFERTSDEQKILIHRVEETIKSIKGLPQSLAQTEIDVLVRANERTRDLARQN